MYPDLSLRVAAATVLDRFEEDRLSCISLPLTNVVLAGMTFPGLPICRRHPEVSLD